MFLARLGTACYIKRLLFSRRTVFSGKSASTDSVQERRASVLKFICTKSENDTSASTGQQGGLDDDDEDDDDDDWSNMDTSPLEKSPTGSHKMKDGIDQDAHPAIDSDEDYMRPQPRKERIKKALATLKKGPDGRFINVLEVTSDIHMLIAAYQSLKAKSRPTYLIEDSDEDDSMEGIDLKRFKKLQKRLRGGTYRFATTKEPKKS